MVIGGQEIGKNAAGPFGNKEGSIRWSSVVFMRGAVWIYGCLSNCDR
jgi:hypothetical protein